MTKHAGEVRCAFEVTALEPDLEVFTEVVRQALETVCHTEIRQLVRIVTKEEVQHTMELWVPVGVALNDGSPRETDG